MNIQFSRSAKAAARRESDEVVRRYSQVKLVMGNPSAPRGIAQRSGKLVPHRLPLCWKLNVCSAGTSLRGRYRTTYENRQTTRPRQPNDGTFAKSRHWSGKPSLPCAQNRVPFKTDYFRLARDSGTIAKMTGMASPTQNAQPYLRLGSCLDQEPRVSFVHADGDLAALDRRPMPSERLAARSFRIVSWSTGLENK